MVWPAVSFGCRHHAGLGNDLAGALPCCFEWEVPDILVLLLCSDVNGHAYSLAGYVDHKDEGTPAKAKSRPSSSF